MSTTVATCAFISYEAVRMGRITEVITTGTNEMPPALAAFGMMLGDVIVKLVALVRYATSLAI